MLDTDHDVEDPPYGAVHPSAEVVVVRRWSSSTALAAVVIMWLVGATPAWAVTGPPVARNQADPSPAGCRILYVENPHPSASVPGSVKVNAKSQCTNPVPELDLSVTLLVDGKPLVKTVTTARNKAYILNQGTYLQCTNFVDQHTFQGAALGTSFEDGQPYIQILEGNAVTLPCGY